MARDKIKQLNPDVLTLDVEMPRMDGVTFLGNLMRLRPMPVVMVSTLTEQGADVTLRALEYGAVDFVAKPKLDVAEKLKDYAAEIIEKVRVAGHRACPRWSGGASGLAKTGGYAISEAFGRCGNQAGRRAFPFSYYRSDHRGWLLHRWD